MNEWMNGATRSQASARCTNRASSTSTVASTTYRSIRRRETWSRDLASWGTPPLQPRNLLSRQPPHHSPTAVLDECLVDDGDHFRQRAIRADERAVLITESAPLLRTRAVGLGATTVTRLLGEQGHPTTLTLFGHQRAPDDYFVFVRRRRIAAATKATAASPTTTAANVSQSDVQKLTPDELNVISRMIRL